MTNLKRPHLAAVVITRDEEKNIGACLESLDFADRLIVVDSGSQDRTVEIARKYTDLVFERAWTGYGDQKNFAIERAERDWVLVVDADERVTPELEAEIRTVLESDPPEAGFFIPRKNIFFGRWVRGGEIYPDYQLRLFRSSGRYNSLPVHENLVIPGKIERLQGSLIHFTAPSVVYYARKMDGYTSLAARGNARRKGSVLWLHLIFSPPARLIKKFILKSGWRDGTHGLVLSLWAGYYAFLKYAKLWVNSQTRDRERSRGCSG